MGRVGGKGFWDKRISMCKAMKIRESENCQGSVEWVEACGKRWQVSCVPLNKENRVRSRL